MHLFVRMKSESDKVFLRVVRKKSVISDKIASIQWVTDHLLQRGSYIISCYGILVMNNCKQELLL